MTYKIYLNTDEIEKESDSKKIIRLSEEGFNYQEKKTNFTTDELLFIMACLPTKIFLNRANCLNAQQRHSEVKQEIALIEAKATIEISQDKTYTNQTGRDSALIVLLNDGKSDLSKSYLEKKKELNKLYEDKEMYKNLADYHKDLSWQVSKHLDNIDAMIENERDLIKNEVD